ANEINDIPRHIRERTDDVPVLRREILMNEQVYHNAKFDRIWSRSAGAGAGAFNARAASSRLARRRSTTSANWVCSKWWTIELGVKPQRWAICAYPAAMAMPNPNNTSCAVTGPAAVW